VAQKNHLTNQSNTALAQNQSLTIVNIDQKFANKIIENCIFVKKVILNYYDKI